MEQTNRNIQIDLMRFVGISAVVMSHCNIFVDFVCQFHIPLFMFVSGIMHSGKGKIKQLPSYIVKKIKGIYCKFVGIEIMLVLLHNFFLNIHFIEGNKYGFITSVKKIINILSLGDGESLGGALWFLISLFEITILFEIIHTLGNEFNNKFVKILLVVLIICLTIIGWKYSLPRMLNRTLKLLPYYSLGYALKCVRNKDLKCKYSLLIIGTVIVAIISKYSPTWANDKYIILTYISGVSGISVCYIIAYIIDKSVWIKIRKVLAYIGKNSLYIMAYHLVAFKLVAIIMIVIWKKDIVYLAEFPCYMPIYPWNIIYLIVGIVVPILVAVVVKKVSSLIRSRIEASK